MAAHVGLVRGDTGADQLLLVTDHGAVRKEPHQAEGAQQNPVALCRIHLEQTVELISKNKTLLFSWVRSQPV